MIALARREKRPHVARSWKGHLRLKLVGDDKFNCNLWVALDIRNFVVIFSIKGGFLLFQLMKLGFCCYLSWVSG
ncbi:hypothetical protein RHMOL_Rhmol02G0090600 [Rhododendron molle]|uniref:Uncharacterized protein n=1 Tax=Rhododendron molle TaxID=49168 RepID=A0ACC0PNI8_RHOML|nr:hypothetical protein RHMOL_Rhmol02G0090600 [Rhododendron molle]